MRCPLHCARALTSAGLSTIGAAAGVRPPASGIGDGVADLPQYPGVCGGPDPVPDGLAVCVIRAAAQTARDLGHILGASRDASAALALHHVPVPARELRS